MKRNTSDRELLELCNKLLVYNPDTGEFLNKTNGRGRIKGKILNTIDNNGYIRLVIKAVHYSGHRLAFLMTYGYLPEFLDHKNNIRHDNRLKNLRECTRSQNNQNKKKRKSSRKYIGVYKLPSGSWRATCKQKHIGCFDTEEEAAEAYNKRAIELFGEFAFTNKITQ